MPLLSSLQNPLVKHIVRLRQRRYRDESNAFLIEGYRELLRASRGAVSMEKFFYCPSLFLGENNQALIEQCSKGGKTALYEVTEPVFRKISYRDRPDGLIAIAKKRDAQLQDIAPQASFFVVAQSIEKPGNLGSILRSCDGAGVDALLLCDPVTDIYNPNVIRSSIGTLFHVPVIATTTKEALAFLSEREAKIVATSPSARQAYTKVDLRGKVALVVGCEQLGLTREWMAHANTQVFIPMQGVADSLNVAAATTLMLYEVLRQRCLS